MLRKYKGVIFFIFPPYFYRHICRLCGPATLNRFAAHNTGLSKEIPTPTSVATPTVEQIVIADCAWQRQGYVWLDTNGNGEQDQDEPPLTGVPFYVKNSRNGYTNVGVSAVSDEDGIVEIFVWMPGCPPASLEVTVGLTDQYTSTTPLIVPIDNLEPSDEPIAFGLIGPTPEPTKSPLQLTCHQFWSSVGWGDIPTVAPDGTLWNVQSSEVRMLNFETDESETTNIVIDGKQTFSMGFDIGPQGMLWATTDDGIAHRDENGWHNLSAGNIAKDASYFFVVDVIALPNGKVWALTSEGLFSIDPSTNLWASVDDVTFDFGNTSFTKSIFSADDSLWIISSGILYQAIWDSSLTEVAQWNRYAIPSGVEWITDGTVDPIGDVWIVANDNKGASILGNLNSSSGEWQLASYQTTNGKLPADSFQAIAASSTNDLWIGLGDSGLWHVVAPEDFENGFWMAEPVAPRPKEKSIHNLTLLPDNYLFIAHERKETWRCKLPE